ncbi:MAG: ABC transporter ATP-binding protein [PVC group bacterium]|nr:ABC transporter ATP-binding protein [PVC group bacterium]
MLEIKKLTCGYNQQFFLKDIDVNLPGEQIVGVIGPNGSGKTTLLRAISRVINPVSGSMFFEGRDINLISGKEVARKIAVVSQDMDIPSELQVEEFVGLGRIPHQSRFQFFQTKQDQEVVMQALEETGTVKFKDRVLGSLSGGERQLVVIAKALAQQPKLLLLDEPTVFLDISHQVEILDLIRRLHKTQKLSIIVVLHELNLASEYCDRLLLLNNGCLHRDGTPEHVLDYRIIEQVYKTAVVVKDSPVSGKPCVFVVPEEEMNRG